MSWLVLTRFRGWWADSWTENDQPLRFATLPAALEAINLLLDATPEQSITDYKVIQE